MLKFVSEQSEGLTEHVSSATQIKVISEQQWYLSIFYLQGINAEKMICKAWRKINQNFQE